MVGGFILDTNDKSSGKGRIIYLNSVYEGYIVNSKEQGQGKKTFSDGVIY
jgi:hypothetical protein